MKPFTQDDLIAVPMAILLAGTLAAATVGARATVVSLRETTPTFASLNGDTLALRESCDDLGTVDAKAAERVRSNQERLTSALWPCYDRVAGGSIMPRVTTGNTMAPCRLSANGRPQR